MATASPYTPTPKTLLEAVNQLLAAAGITAVASLAIADDNADVEDALKTIHNISMDLQTTGYWFNREEDYPLDPNEDGEVMVPANTLAVDPSSFYCPSDGQKNMVQRGQRLYDKTNRTYNIGARVHADLVLGLDFEDTPQSFRSYLTMKAARDFAAQRSKDSATAGYTADMEAEALVRFEAEEDQADDRPLDQKNPSLARKRRFRRRT